MFNIGSICEEEQVKTGDPKSTFVAALNGNACAVILSHNHPSGNLNPSQADIKLTKDMVAAGKFLHIPVLDHVIMTRQNLLFIR